MLTKEEFKNLISDDNLILVQDFDLGTMIIKAGTKAHIDRVLSQSHGQEPFVTIIFDVCSSLSVREPVTQSNVMKLFSFPPS